MMCVRVRCTTYTETVSSHQKVAGGPSPVYQSMLELQLKSPSCCGPSGDEGPIGVCSWLNEVFGKALITALIIVGISSFVYEWLLFVEVSWASDGRAVDGDPLRGLFQRPPSVLGFPNVVLLVLAHWTKMSWSTTGSRWLQRVLRPQAQLLLTLIDNLLKLLSLIRLC